MEKRSGGRILFVDVVKIVAMVCVIGLHTLAGIPLLYATCSIAIPLFFMSTGYLMYDRDYSVKYVVSKLWHIIRYVVLVNLVYWLVAGFLSNSWDFRQFVNGISITGDHPFWHFWFFGSLLIVYVLLPLFKMMRAYQLPVLFGLFLLLQVIFLLNLFVNDGTPFEAKIPQAFRIYTWIFYCLLGGIMKSFMARIPSVKIWFVLSVLVLNAIFQYLLTPGMNDIRCEYFYSSMVVAACCVIVFKYISQFCYERESLKRIISELSSVFLPVFTIHIFMINPVFDMVQPYVGLFTRPISWPIVAFLSILISVILMHIKYVNSLIRL